MNVSPVRVNGTALGFRFVWGLFWASAWGGFGPAFGGQVDRWLADDLAGLNDGEAVGIWTSQGHRAATGSAGLQPTFRKKASPVGGPVVRFNQSFMTVGDSPLGGATSFSLALVFKPAAGGANGGNWYQCTGLVDAEQSFVMTDWGTVLDASGRVALGTGSPDTTTFSSGASLVDSNFHVAVFTWGGGAQSVYVDNRPAVSQSGVSTSARMNAGFAFGGILTGQGGAAQRFVGDLVEARFYNTKLNATEVSDLIQQLADTHLNATQPIIRSFAAETNQIRIGAPVALSWDVRTNATALLIEPGVGAVSGFSNSVLVWPRTNTTYTLTASNAFGVRTAQATVRVVHGITAQPQTVTTNPGATVSFTVTAVGVGTLSYQWRRNGASVPGATNATLSLTNVQLAQNAAYSVLVKDEVTTFPSEPAWLIVLVKPVLTQAPTSLVVAVGETATLTASASGTLPLGARWLKNSNLYEDFVTLPDHEASLTFINLDLTNGGGYTAVFSNYAAPYPTAPQETAPGYVTVVVPPTNQLAAAGTTVTLLAGGNGMVARYCAWEFNGAALWRGTNPPATLSVTNSLTVTNLQSKGAGYYSFLITNAVNYSVTNDGVITSNWMALGKPRTFTAYLGISTPGAPAIVLDPTNQLVRPGATATFNVLAGGSAPLSYQWYFNTTNLLPGQTNASLVLSNAQPAQSGGYCVVVTNPAGTATSQAAEMFFTTTDSDWDGVPDWAEMQAGTDPQDPASFLKVEALLAEANGVTLRFTAVSNRTYSVVYAAETPPQSWAVLTNVAAWPTDRQVLVTNVATSASQRLFRLATPQLP